MSERPRQRNQYDPGKQFYRIDETYVFDSASGIYKRKGEKAEDRRHYDDNNRLRVSVARDWIVLGINILTLAVVLAYTYYAKRTVEVMKESEDRPWVQLGDDEMFLQEPPEFYHITHNGLANLVGTEMEVKVPITINNVGARIAKRYSTWAELFPDTDREPQGAAPWGEWWKSTCQTASANMEGSTTSAQSRPLLPGVKRKTVTAEAFWMQEQPLLTAERPRHIRKVYIVVCVTYREMNGDDHFTAVTFCPSSFSEHPSKVLDNPDTFYDLKQTEFWACNHEAN